MYIYTYVHTCCMHTYIHTYTAGTMDQRLGEQIVLSENPSWSTGPTSDNSQFPIKPTPGRHHLKCPRAYTCTHMHMTTHRNT